MKKISVFYAWQNDTLPIFNRHLIRIALEIAAENLSNDVNLNAQVIVDSDTQGVPGTPPVSDTILAKINKCDVFAPDLSFVSRTDSGKYIPNPNVMTEYGYALRAKTHAAMMPIMNTTYGPPEQLPFDLGHLRHPIQYHVEPTAKNAARRSVRLSLAADIEKALRLIISAQGEQSPILNPLISRAKAIKSPAFFFQQNEVLASFGEPGEQEYRFGGKAVMYLRLAPAYEPSEFIGLAKLQEIFNRLQPCPMNLKIGGQASRNSYGPIIIDNERPTTVHALTQGFATGELWGLSSQAFRTENHETVSGSDYKVTTLGIISLEKIFVRNLRNFVKVMSDFMRYPLPYWGEFGIADVKDVVVIVPGGPFNKSERVGPILVDSVSKNLLLIQLSTQS